MNIVGATLSKLIEDIMSLMGDVIHQVNCPPTCTCIYHSQGALKASLFACWFTNLS